MLKVLASPDHLALNPYPTLLYDEVRKHDVAVERYTVRKALTEKPDIIHFHWPHVLAPAKGGAQAHLKVWARQALEKAAALPTARARGARVFWTVHNLRGHDQKAAGLEALDWSLFLRMVDATFHLSEAGRDLAFEEIPRIRDLPSFIVPHGPYPVAQAADTSRADARAQLGLPADKRIVLFFGLVRGYKNVPALIDAFLAADDPDMHLVVAGKIHPTAEDVGARLRALAETRSDITVFPEFIEDERLATMARAADICVFPYREILNSGSTYFALSSGRPVLVPESPVFNELAARLGDAWVQRFQGTIDAATLRDAAHAPGPADAAPSFDEISWAKAGAVTADAYREVSAARRR